MPVVGYNPPNEKPQDLAFFSYGCCVSTTQALWMVIGTFALSVGMLVTCCFSAVFVRWVYKRRMRKKLEGLKDKYRQEEKFKKEVEMNLKEIAKRPIVRPQRNDYMKNIERSLEQLSTVNVHGMSVPFPVFRPSATNMNQPSATAIGQQVKSTEALKSDVLTGVPMGGPNGVIFEVPTMAGVVHQMALADSCQNNKNSQPPFPGIAIKQNVKRSREETKADLPMEKMGTPQEKKEETTEEKRKTENEKKPSPMKKAGGETTNGKEEEGRPRTKRAVDRKGSAEGRVFPYFAGTRHVGNEQLKDTGSQETEGEAMEKESKDKMENQEKRKSAETEEKTGSTQSSPAVSESKRPSVPIVNQEPGYSVYHLRRIAEEQGRVAETERAREMLGQRETTGEKRAELNHEDLERLMRGESAEKKTADVVEAKDIPNNEDSPSRR